ncbi:hypothetical protein D3C75_740050 [compost metagenome]
MAADFCAFPAGILFAFCRQTPVLAEAGNQPVKVIAFEIKHLFGEGVNKIGIGNLGLVHPEIAQQRMVFCEWNGVVYSHFFSSCLLNYRVVSLLSRLAFMLIT